MFEERLMIKLRIPKTEVVEFNDNLSAWSTASGIDPRLTIDTDYPKTTNFSSPTLYLVCVDESFFTQYPKWRQFLEH
jgi:hypothetical protein